MNELGISFTLHGLGELEITETLPRSKREALAESLQKYGITIIDDQKTALVQQIKYAIDEMLQDDISPLLKVSTYLSEKLNYSYAHLSNLFSELTHTSIENYVILKKVDFAKELMIHTDLSLTEIAFRLHYSSVSHLSGQFKKITGLNPTAFRRIIKKRAENRSKSE